MVTDRIPQNMVYQMSIYVEENTILVVIVII